MQPSNAGFNLKVVYAENGFGYTIPVNPSVVIENIKTSLVSATGLSTFDQILLSDKNLQPKRTLESYGIVKDKEIYLFNRKILDNFNLKPEEVDISLQDFRKIPKRPAPSNLYEFESSPNPLNKLYAMEYHLNNHLLGIKYVKEEFEKKLVICQNFQSDIHHQKRALNAACFSFFEYRDNLVNSANKFFKEFRISIPNYDSVLSSFELDMSKLKQIKLHDSLKSNNRNTLADCIPENDFRKWHKQCKEEFEAIKSKISELENQILFFCKNSDLDLKRSDTINPSDLSSRMQILKEHFERVKVTNQSFSTNYEKIKQTLDQTRTMNDPNKISSMLLGFVDIKKQQDDSFQQCSNANNAFEAMAFIVKSKNFMNQHVYIVLRSISKFQEKFKEIKSPLTLYSEAVSKFADNFIQLEIIHRLPQAYEESLLEITRRKKLGHTITFSLNKFIESLKMIKEDENQKRQLFFEQYLQYIPIQSFNGLKDQLPDFQFNLPPFDSNLPNLNIGGIGSSAFGNNNSSNNNNNLISGGSGGIGGFSTTSGHSSNNEDDGFTVIDNLTDNFNNLLNNNNNNNNNINNINSSLITSNHNLITSQISSKKLLNDLERSQIENKQLEMKLQTTFLMASKTEEKYKDLLEKSMIDKQQPSINSLANLETIKKIEEQKRELEEKKKEITMLSDELAKVCEINLLNQQSTITLQDQKVELLSTIDDLQFKITNYKQRVAELEIEQLEKETNSTRSIENLTTELSEKNEEIKLLNQEINQLTSCIKQLKTNVVMLEDGSQSKEKEKLLISSEIEELRSRLSSLTMEQTNLLVELDISKQESTSTTEKSKQFELESLKYQELVKQLELANAQLEQKVESITECKLLDSKKLNDQISVLQLTIEQSEKEINEKSKRISMVQLELQELSSSNQLVIADNSRLVDELKIVRIELETTGATSNDKFQSSQQLNLELVKNKQLLESNIEKLNAELLNLNNVNDTLNTLVQEQIVQIEQSNHKINELQASIDSFETKDSAMKLQIEKLTNDLEASKQQTTRALDSTTKNYDVKIQQLESTIQKLQQQDQDQQNQLASTTNDNNNLKSEVETLTLELDKKQEQEEKHANDLKDLQTYFNGELSRSESENDKLKLKNDENIATIQSLKEMLKNDKTIHKKEMSSLLEKEKQLADKEKQFADKEKLLAEKEKQLQEKDKTIVELKAKVAQSASTNLMPEVQSLRSAMYELSKTIDPNSKECLETNIIVSSIKKTVYDSFIENQGLLERIGNLENQQALDRSQSAMLSNFTHDRTAIFYRNKNNYYEAINMDSPNYFLSPISYDQYPTEMRTGTPLIGTIIQVDSKIAGNSDSFGCLPGTEIYEVLVSSYNNTN